MKKKFLTLSLALTLLAAGMFILAACNTGAFPAQTSGDTAGQGLSADSKPLPQMADGQAAFTGVVEAVGADIYTVSGAVFKIDQDSRLPANLDVGTTVKITAQVNSDGSFYAQAITPALEASGSTDLFFGFAGVVESINGSTAVISGQAVELPASSLPDLQIGDTVRVQGTLSAGVFRAHEVEIDDDEREATRTPQATDDDEREATHTPEPTDDDEREATHTPEPTEDDEREATRTPQATEDDEREATHTPEPTDDEHEATRTPQATDDDEHEATLTPGPTETREHEATRTPEPTETREHEATRTPEPTEDHEATHTPEPTEEHEATQTPEPPH